MFQVESEALGIENVKPSLMRMYAQMNWLFHKCLILLVVKSCDHDQHANGGAYERHVKSWR
jgi:hypothetical protein